MEDCSVVCPNFDNIDWESPSVQPNPDISGLGVVIGFITSAYMTVALVMVYYVMDCVSKTYNTNAVDKAFLGVLRKISSLQLSKYWEPAIRNAILILSDQQLVTGISLLASGYSQLICSLSSYHWQILVYLGWFSTLTHLTTLTILREYLQENPGIRTWRVLLMLLTFVLLVIALLPTGDSKWLFWPPLDPSPYTDGVPVLCFFKILGVGGRENQFTNDPDQTSTMVISIVVLCFGYMTRLIKISAWATNFTNQWCREWPGNLLKRRLAETESRSLLPGASLYWKLKRIVLGTIYLALRASLDLYSSLLWEIMWLVFAMVWGSIHLFHARKGITKRNGEMQQSIWGFGQCVSVILLAQPLLSIAENCYETRRKAKQSIATKITSSCSGNPVAGVDDHDGHDKQKGPGAQPHELPNSTRRVQSSDVEWHSGHLQASNARSITLLSTPSEGQSSVVQGPEQIHNSSRSESFWILVTLILVMTSELIIYMLYNTSQGIDFYLTWVMVVVLLLFILVSCMTYALFCVALPQCLPKWVLSNRMWQMRGRSCGRGLAYLYSMSVVGMETYILYNNYACFVDSQCSTGARNLWWLPAKAVGLPWSWKRGLEVYD